MHKLRREARYQSWYPDEEGNGTYNPFSKARPPRRRVRIADGDEDGLPINRIQSEGAFTDHQDQERKTGFSSPGVQHPSTMPAGHTASSGPLSAPNESEAVLPQRESHDHGSTRPVEATNGTTALESEKEKDKDISVPTPSAANPTSGQKGHRRRKLKNLMHRKPKDKDLESQTSPQDAADDKAQKQKFTLWSQIRYSLFNSWINVLLICAPIGIALNFVKTVNPIIVFVINFIAIIPLAGTLSYATEEIALRTGETIGGLLNATFGNAVELIVSIIALFHDQITIVQTSLIGSMLSNLLLVMGMCFFFGGLPRVEQHFNVTVAQTASSLLALAIGSLVIPTAFFAYGNLPSDKDDASVDNLIAQLSRGTSILLLAVYGAYLFFQLHTHVAMYNEPSKKSPKRRQKIHKGAVSKAMANAGGSGAVAGAGATTNGEIKESTNVNHEEKEEPQLSLWGAFITLGWSTVLVALCAEFMVDAINDVVASTGVSKTFIGLILLPIVGNAAEHATAVTVACKDKMDLAIGVAVGSSMQIALLVLPLVVTIGWIAGKQDMNLNFDPFEVIVLFIAVLLVNYLIADGKSHWLEGVLLQTLYLIITLAAWFFPNDATQL